MSSPQMIMEKRLLKLAELQKQLAEAKQRDAVYYAQAEMANIILNQLRQINGRYK